MKSRQLNYVTTMQQFNLSNSNDKQSIISLFLFCTEKSHISERPNDLIVRSYLLSKSFRDVDSLEKNGLLPVNDIGNVNQMTPQAGRNLNLHG